MTPPEATPATPDDDRLISLVYISTATAPLDDAAFQLVQDLLQFINDNPAKSEEWKAKADAAQRPEAPAE